MSFYSAPGSKEAEKAIVFRVLEQGGSLQDAGSAAGVTTTSARNWAQAAGLAVDMADRIRLERQQRAVAMVRDGSSPVEAAEAAGVHLGTLLRWCREREVRTLHGAHPRPVRHRALELVRQGQTASDAALAVGVPAATVADWCNKEGLALAPLLRTHRHVVSVTPEIVRRLVAGDHPSDIASAVEVSPDTVKRIAAGRGIAVVRRDTKRPVVVRDLDELDAEIEAVMAMAAHAARTQDGDRHSVNTYLRWSAASDLDATSFASVADYLLHMAKHGRSGRSGSRGQACGSTAVTIRGARAAIDRWLNSEGFPGCKADPLVAMAFEEAKRDAPVGDGGRRRLTQEELDAIAADPPPLAPARVLRLRIAIHVARVVDRPATEVAGRLETWSPTGATFEEQQVLLSFPATRKRPSFEATLAHRPGEAVGCGHCAALELRDLAAQAGADATICGHLRDAWKAACRRTGLDAALLAPDDEALDRLLWCCDPALITWARRHGVQALLRCLGWRISDAIGLDVEHIALPSDPAEPWAITRVQAKNDQLGSGFEVHLHPLHSPNAVRAVQTWLFVRGLEPGPIFPGRGHVARLHRSTAQDNLVAAARAAGIDVTRVGTHSYRHTTLSELLDQDISIFRVAKRFGVTAETAFGYYDQIPFRTNVSAELGLGEQS